MDEKDARRAGEAAEELSRGARESYRAAVDRAFEAQKGNMRLSRRFFEHWVETMQGLTELVREQREVYRTLSGESLDAYDGFVGSLSTYYEEVSKDPEEPGG
jgi:hypothetical protein